MLKSYMEVNQDIIQILKDRGYTSVEFVPQESTGSQQATVEVIPSRRKDFNLNVISLDSHEIGDYVGEASPMAKYIIDKKYLIDRI
ncbi:MAG: hypothetical protein V4721_02595 [Bacteroidota bacterium]